MVETLTYRITMKNNEITKAVSMEDIQAAIPSRKNAVTDEVVELINKSLSEPEFQGESLLQTATTYESVLRTSKASIKDYLYAIKFVAYMVSMDDNYTEAYKKTFFDREFVKERLTEPTGTTKYKELTSAASRYRKSKLVVDILTLSQVPLDLMFTGYRYKAIGILADVMENARYDRDKINAAKELLAATKGSENMKIELDVGVRENSAVQQLQEQLAVMAGKQKMLLESGAANLLEFGAMKVKADDVIEGEVL
jgi:hypothetical protein